MTRHIHNILLVVMIIVILLFVIYQCIGTPESGELNVTPMIQQDYDCVCHGTTIGMIFRYYDDNYDTNYLGDPFDSDLLNKSCDHVFVRDLIDVMYGSHQSTINMSMSVAAWAWWRNQPIPVVTEYEDLDYWKYSHPNIDSNNYPTINFVDINYEFLKAELVQGRPFFTLVNNGNHAIVSYGWDDTTDGLYEYPRILTYYTYTCDAHLIEVDRWLPGDTNLVQSVFFFDFGL